MEQLANSKLANLTVGPRFKPDIGSPETTFLLNLVDNSAMRIIYEAVDGLAIQSIGTEQLSDRAKAFLVIKRNMAANCLLDEALRMNAR